MAAPAGRLAAFWAGLRLPGPRLLPFGLFGPGTGLGLAPLEVFPKGGREPGRLPGLCGG